MVSLLGFNSDNPLLTYRHFISERHERVANLWTQARVEVLQERHLQLQEKVKLQHLLLRAQDHLAEARLRQQLEKQLRKRQEDKRARQNLQAALLSVCKSSLEEDRKKADALKKTSRKKNVTIASHHDGFDSGSDEPLSAPINDGPNDLSDQHHLPRHFGSSRPSLEIHQQHLPAPPLRECLESQEGIDHRKTLGEKFPWHHAQLYQLYGQETADYFLHPKPQKVEPMKRPSLTKLKQNRGHVSAEEVWDVLRTDSKTKLLTNDRHFPPELKEAFSAFVREGLTKNIKPVERSFCATEDVPNILQLMDQSKLRRTNHSRHKAEIMYRSSLNNKDRTSVLLYNNPLPNISGTGCTESISWYLPSWMEKQLDHSKAECKKSNKPALKEAENDKETMLFLADHAQQDNITKELQNIWQNVVQRTKPMESPRYKFLTEKDAESVGVFREKFQEIDKDQKESPTPGFMLQSIKPHSAFDFTTDSSLAAAADCPQRSSSTTDSKTLHHSNWLPLTMNALVEYKRQMETKGKGEFDHGRAKMWPVPPLT